MRMTRTTAMTTPKIRAVEVPLSGEAAASLPLEIVSMLLLFPVEGLSVSAAKTVGVEVITVAATVGVEEIAVAGSVEAVLGSDTCAVFVGLSAVGRGVGDGIRASDVGNNVGGGEGCVGWGTAL
jgi:hypothetical protein